jgi:biotin transport system substrate-specific component
MTLALPSADRRVLADLVVRPLRRGRAAAIDAGLIAAGVVVVALLAKVAFFIGPVPITGQTAGVVLVGAVLGARRGALSLAAYAAAGIAGVPVFAGVVAGPAYVLMPSFGFVLGFIPAAFVAGWFAERAWDRRPAKAFVALVAASIVPFVIGVPYMTVILAVVMSADVSLASVLADGVVPFVVPGLLKAGAVALVLPGAWALVRRVDRAR